jgi:Ca-activated chloride channel family protein
MELTLAQLAKRGGVSARTVRYYIQRGLLPAPAFRGPDTCYAEAHLLGLQAIRALQAAYWPLDAIAAALHGRSADQLRAIAGGTLPELRGTAIDSDAGSPSARTHGSRIVLRDGLELWLDDRASESVRELAQVIERWAAKQKPGVTHE